ncbi:MAG TPA: S9 family peptidase, partial [Candidatus Limnocylindria bacterium]|nr:S9 family peptidase [Candidatus Limnocylindria bacterium]
MPKPSYPPAPTSDQVDDYHGVAVADPYRPLEDTDAPETRRWIAAENDLTERVLSGLAARGEIRARLAELWDFPRAGAPIHRGDRWFQLRNTGLQDQDVLWVSDAPDDPGRVLLDPNGLSQQGTRALSAMAISEDGERLAYAISDAGSDWRTWSVREVATGDDLADRVTWSKFASAAWTADGEGFVYGRYPEPPPDAAYDAPNLQMELCYHRLGTDAADDVVVLSVPEHPDWGFEPMVTDEGRLLVVSVWRGTDPENRLWVADLAGGVDSIEVRRLLDVPDARYEPIGAVDGTLYLLTDRDAPNGRV